MKILIEEIMTVKSILEKKNGKVYRIKTDATVEQAVREMVRNKVGALIVVNNNDQVMGIVSERDIVRKLMDSDFSVKNLAVDKIMSRKLIICTPEDDLDYVQNVMTEMRIRHVPVFEEHNLVGIISIGDVVKARLAKAHFEIRFYEDYIQGKYPG